eukprot:1610858-Pleurochrysis_carterae.AAC.1
MLGHPTPIAAADAQPSDAFAKPTSMAEAYGGIPACPRKALLLFSGPYRRADGPSAFLRRFGVDTVCVDNDPAHGRRGPARHTYRCPLQPPATAVR